MTEAFHIAQFDVFYLINGLDKQKNGRVCTIIY